MLPENQMLLIWVKQQCFGGLVFRLAVKALNLHSSVSPSAVFFLTVFESLCLNYCRVYCY